MAAMKRRRDRVPAGKQDGWNMCQLQLFEIGGAVQPEGRRRAARNSAGPVRAGGR
jgi:hypothetical protein